MHLVHRLGWCHMPGLMAPPTWAFCWHAPSVDCDLSGFWSKDVHFNPVQGVWWEEDAKHGVWWWLKAQGGIDGRGAAARVR